jgi:predicted metalloprotease
MSHHAGPSESETPPLRRSPGRRPLVLAVVAVLAVIAVAVVIALAVADDESPSAGGGDGGRAGLTTGGSVVELRNEPEPLPRVAHATIASLRTYWSAEMPKLYDKEFRDLAGGFQAKTPDSPAWTCNDERLTYADIRGNAFYCGGQDDDYIAYDAAFLLPQLNRGFGSLTPAVVLAHEMGHAIQARARVDAPSVVAELQADCFAGAWVAYARSSPSDPVVVNAEALDSSVRAIPLLRDQPGTPATNPQAHGLGFDRVNAYQTGYAQGAAECATFPDGNVVVTELPFDPIEAQTGGNVPITDVIPFVTDHLDAFWSASLSRLSATAAYRPPRRAPQPALALPPCADDPGYDKDAVTAYCVPSNTVAYAAAPLVRLDTEIGDLAPGAALSLSWARAAQSQAGLETSGGEAELQQVCFTGAWVSSLASDPDLPFRLSPGDVDEVLLAVLSPLSPHQAREVLRSSFERADALRTGLLEGLSACEE